MSSFLGFVSESASSKPLTLVQPQSVFAPRRCKCVSGVSGLLWCGAVHVTAGERMFSCQGESDKRV